MLARKEDDLDQSEGRMADPMAPVEGRSEGHQEPGGRRKKPKRKEKKNKKKGERNEMKKNSGLAQEMAPTPQTGGAQVIQRVVLLGNRWRRRFAPLQLGQVPLEIHLGQL